MVAHVHAALMAEYAKDALETDKPWELWEVKYDGVEKWDILTQSALWNPTSIYRRKRVPICQVEGKDVFAGDKLWHREDGRQYVIDRKHKGDGSYIFTTEEYILAIINLSWTEPVKTKTVYQWAYCQNNSDWKAVLHFYASEEDFRNGYELASGVAIRRLDYTALEIPA